MAGKTERNQEARFLVEDKDGFLMSLTESEARAHSNNRGKTVLPRRDEQQILDEVFYKIRGRYPKA
jgi:hypothetical protein